MTINPHASDPARDVRGAAESRGFDSSRLSGTVQADILKEYVAQKEWIFPSGRRCGSCAT